MLPQAMDPLPHSAVLGQVDRGRLMPVGITALCSVDGAAVAALGTMAPWPSHAGLARLATPTESKPSLGRLLAPLPFAVSAVRPVGSAVVAVGRRAAVLVDLDTGAATPPVAGDAAACDEGLLLIQDGACVLRDPTGAATAQWTIPGGGWHWAGAPSHGVCTAVDCETGAWLQCDPRAPAVALLRPSGGPPPMGPAALASSGGVLFSGTAQGLAAVDLRGGHTVPLWALAGFACHSVSALGHRVAAAAGAQVLALDARRDGAGAVVHSTLHAGPVTAVALLKGGDRPLILSAGSDTTCALWAVASR